MQPDSPHFGFTHHHKKMFSHGLTGNRLIEGQPNHRHPGSLPGFEPGMAHPGPFGNEAVPHRFRQRGPIPGRHTRVYDNVVTGRGLQGIGFIELAGQSPGIEPAPLAVCMGQNGDVHLGWIALHAPQRHHRPVELKDDLAPGRDVGTGRGYSHDRQ